ncbi:MAG TPA: hypothetical protein VEH76_07470 [Methylocystis sp.]|nr:hypothetical protein [Methylocystis sp.]
MGRKLAYELMDGSAPNSYLIRLTDAKQAAALGMGEGFGKSFKLEPIPVIYDEGNGELVLAHGFEDATAQGRIAMRVLGEVYCDAMDRILARKRSGQAENKSGLSLSFFL